VEGQEHVPGSAGTSSARGAGGTTASPHLEALRSHRLHAGFWTDLLTTATISDFEVKQEARTGAMMADESNYKYFHSNICLQDFCKDKAFIAIH